MIRIGHGFDVHAFEEGNSLVIGGQTIPFHAKFKAHSDGDVLLHAICDALLGALALGDIGRHFPDTDPKFSQIESKHLLRSTFLLIKEKNYKINNIDATIIAEKPKMTPYIPDMINHISDILALQPSQINIKATTTEKLGYCGRSEGIAAHAVCTLLAKEYK